MAGSKGPLKDTLKTYRTRRNLKQSPQPAGKKSTKRVTGGRTFVIHKHAASHLHYDFRLAIDGVLKSWAVPKGPSRNPKDKRLAIVTDDHPMTYGTFEGVIPEGSYGAGTVMIWDKGTYRNIKKEEGRLVPMHECYQRGTIEITLKGKKLNGSYALVRTQLHGGDNWLLIKMRDGDGSGKSAISDAVSAISGRTMKEIAADAMGKKTTKRSKMNC
jgi:DNA ligase D-like protein (predicted 3'-phosphoesterase)